MTAVDRYLVQRPPVHGDPGGDPDTPDGATDPVPSGGDPADGFLAVRGRVLYLNDEPAADIGVGVYLR